MTRQDPVALYGNKAIAGWLATRCDFRVSRQTVWRLRRRPEDPLPVREGAPGVQICAAVSDLESWVGRNLPGCNNLADLG